MAQMITLEEAAEKLGITPEAMRKNLKTDPNYKRLSQIRDGSTVRFKLSAIEELARELGLASDPELPLGPIESEPPGSDDFQVNPPDNKKKGKGADEPKTKKVDKGELAEEAPLDFGSTEDDVFSLADEPQPAGPKSGKLTPAKPAKGTSDSSSGGPDSDVRLDGGQSKKGKADESAVPTEEIALDFSGPGSAVIKGGSSAKLSAPKTGGSSGKLTGPDANRGAAPRPPVPDSSEFELSLDADSDDFELQMNADGSSEDEVELGTLPKDKDKPAERSGKSGINLHKPADSGISLEKGKDASKDANKEAEDSESDVDFELSLDSSALPSSSKLGAPKSGKLVLDSDSSSEFELTLDDSGGSSIERAALGQAAEESADKGDIFETDFEIPPMPEESGSEAQPLESDTDLEKSDFELDMDGSDAVEEPSESEVVLLEDEGAEADPDAEAPAPKPKAKAKPKKKPVDADVDLADEPEEDESASKALKGVKGDEDDEPVPAGAIIERPTKPWGIVPVLFLAPSFLVALLGALMGYEMLTTMWGYQQPRKPAAPIIRGLADQFGMDLKDQ